MKYASDGVRAWMCILFFLALRANASGLTITELNYQPPRGGPDLQFVEIYNDASTIADLSGYQFTTGISFTFPEGTLLGGRSYLVVCADLGAVTARYGIANAIGDFQGSLDPEG